MASLREKLLAAESDSAEELDRLYKEDGEFWESLENETDRGLVLAAGAYFETFLENCLESYFDGSKAATELLRNPAGLGSFQARLRCCRALRIIDEDQLISLDMVSKIRNIIAHELMKSFKSPDVKDRSYALFHRLYPDELECEQRKQRSAREAFAFSCFVTALNLQRREISVLIHTRDYPDQLPDYVSSERD